MSEYLSSQELHQLTGYARSGQQSAWLKFRGIPFKQDGARIIVSRVHVQSWLEGKPTMALANTFWIDVYRAQLDDYARKVSESSQIAERAGITPDHPFANQIAALAVDMKIDLPTIEIPDVPKIDIARITPPLNPKH